MTLILYKYNIIVFDKGRLACQIALLKIKDTIFLYKIVKIWDFWKKIFEEQNIEFRQSFKKSYWK